MTPNHTPNAQPTLADLMVRFLATRPDAAPAAAVGPAGGEVEPYEVAAGFAVDPRTAWADATAGVGLGKVPMPADWAGLVGQPAAAFAVPMAAGNFPQRVKDLHPLLANFDPDKLRSVGSNFAGTAGLRAWVDKTAPTNAVLAAGVARAAGDFDRAGELLAADESPVAGNERAALLWQAGRHDEALASWDAAAETPAVHFNRGMARLFLGRFADARAELTKAVAALPEAGGWHALARLYLAVAEING
ncbi:MAG: tetratricopeptide repeat protein [Gemmataceae bacterium]|nr:tetratricopeptide repeat protein [Gemmataceae bacterium]